MSDLEKVLGYQFQRADLLQQALTHKSFHYESLGQSAGHNEKLEFLGDAVIDLVLSELLMEMFPQDDEGHLSKKRASLVNEVILAKLSKKLELPRHLQLGKGEQLTGGDQKPRLLASLYEALLGAIFLDAGFDKARGISREHFKALMKEMHLEEDFSQDYKTKLQEEVQSVLKEAPVYMVRSEDGPPHDRTFEIEVMIRGRALAKASGKSKKAAEQEAAKAALEIWKKAKGSLE